jgi:PAS domain S-box-containing protein
MFKTALPVPSRPRALVVEPDHEVRQRLTRLLREHGMEVMDCANVEQGRELFSDHRLVVAPLNGDNAAMKEFVAWVRAEAGVTQPWIIALGERHELSPGETPSQYGVNDLLTGPMNTDALVKRLEQLGFGSARAALPARPMPPAPPSYQRTRSKVVAPPAATPVPTAWDLASATVLLEHFPAGVAIVDRHMVYLGVNARWIKEFQSPTPHLTGRSHYELFPDLHPDWRVLYESCLAEDRKQTIDDSMTRPDGTESLIHWEIQPWHDGEGAVGGLVLTCTSAEPPVVEAPPAPNSAGDPAFREMAEAAPFGMILLDDEAHVIYANPQHRTVLGFAADPNEPIQTWLERACAGDEVFQKRALDEWWESVWRRHTSLTCSLRNAEGLVKDIEFRPAPLPGDRLLLTIFDVTDARLDEQAVRTSEARYRGLFQQSAAPLLIINPTGNITEVNPAFESLTGIPKHEARRAPLADFLTADTIARLRAATQSPDPSPGFTTTLRHRSGTETPVHLSTAIIRNAQNQPAFTACLMAPLPEEMPALPLVAAAASSTGVDWESITPDWLLLVDAQGIILGHNNSRDFPDPAETEGAPPITGRHIDEALPVLAAALPLDTMIERILDNPGQETRCEYTATLPDETTARQIEARLILLPGDAPSRFGLTLRDVSRARKTSTPGGFSVTLLQHLHTPAILTNERGRILYLNPAAEVLSGYSNADLFDSGLYRLFQPDAPKAFSEELSHQLKTHRSWHALITLTSRDRAPHPGRVELTPAFDEATNSRGFILLFTPVTETSFGNQPETGKRASISLHRARNDLQVLTSLMALQADDSKEPAARAALLASRDRLAAVGLIYRLIQHEDDPIDFARFIQEIGRNLLESHRRQPGLITIDPLFSGITLPQRTAVTVGLMVEELISASLRWSFPDPGAAGHLRITLTTGNGEAFLILRDDGQRLSAAQLEERAASFSGRLLQLLAGQIEGTLTYLSDHENQVRLHFRLPG